MCAPMLAIAAATAAAAGAVKSYGEYQQGMAMSKYYSSVQQEKQQEAQYDLRMGQKQGELIEDQASMESKQLGIKQAESNAASAASVAARGVQGGATAENIVTSDLTKEQMDQNLLKYNAAAKEWSVNEQAKANAWGANVEAAQAGSASKNAKISGRNQAIGTILGTAASIGTQGWLAGLGDKTPKTTFSPSAFGKGLFAGLGG